MRKEVIYYAIDGTAFHSEEECLKYEADASSLGHCVKWFTQSLELIPDTDLNRIESEGVYCYILNRDADKYFKWWADVIGVCRPDCSYTVGHVLEFDNQNNWKNVTKTFNYYANVILAIQRVLNQLYNQTPVEEMEI